MWYKNGKKSTNLPYRYYYSREEDDAIGSSNRTMMFSGLGTPHRNPSGRAADGGMPTEAVRSIRSSPVHPERKERGRLVMWEKGVRSKVVRPVHP